ncbi:uncharacterized protein MYCFIDRAFT_162130 [Pseudocercospora fijiensis CIRAD86]|uniref:4HBT like protein n=1 Tax=Pseudocercospora fijiensis (strain CIRAD86) TaxID=383855 RepID=M3BBE3_PSEFD|nr:uncharacterized protein MYCFIDRAFT_162130 [Pseudocercospora fijiensis CIRAD86]EME86538.1 hypothetical protein MYCFIDRAFT_162130 [Pseudocercospora fijiensis CIRAD86]
MSAATRLPAVAGALTVTGGVIAFFSHPAVQAFVTEKFGANAGSKMLKILAGAIALANLKNLPGLWHVRVLRGIIYQIYFQKRAIPPKYAFAPMITQSYNTLYDTDYNLHKSNSTYFADLDVARAHYVGAIIRTGLARLNAGDQEGLPKSNIEAKGKYVVALGAVSCFFQRQIEPLQRFEVYTRVLSWDRKWLYIVSHIVKKGSIKPDSYVLQPWKNRSKRSNAQKEQNEDLSKHIFASSLARYVFKKGRLTINPEIVLERSRLLPPRPEGIGYPPRAEGNASNAATPFTPATPAVNGEALGTDISSELNSKLAGVKGAEGDDWTWEHMEKERLRGLELASHFDALNGLHNELRAGDVLGKYGDYF